MKSTLATLLILTAAALQLNAQTKGKKPAVVKPQPLSAAVMANGKNIYNKYCLACHMADGAGVPNMNPPLSKTSYVLGDKTRLIKVVLNGLATGEGNRWRNLYQCDACAQLFKRPGNCRGIEFCEEQL